jgi:hypothetical protein
VIREHHDPCEDIISLKDLFEVVQVAHYLVEKLGFSEYNEGMNQSNDYIIEHVAIYENDYRLLIKELFNDINKAMTLYEVVMT